MEEVTLVLQRDRRGGEKKKKIYTRDLIVTRDLLHANMRFVLVHTGANVCMGSHTRGTNMGLLNGTSPCMVQS